MTSLAKRGHAVLPILLLAVLLAGCGARRCDHLVRVSLRDATGRIGPPPWRVWAFPALAFYALDERDAWEHTLLTQPERPYLATVRTTDSLWLWERVPSLVRLGLFLPALKTGGWWSAEIEPRDGQTWTGVARFCPWGNARPDGDAPRLPLTVAAKAGRQGWELTVTAEIPAS